MWEALTGAIPPQVLPWLALTALLMTVVPRIVTLYSTWLDYRSGRRRDDLERRKLEITRLRLQVEELKRRMPDLEMEVPSITQEVAVPHLEMEVSSVAEEVEAPQEQPITPQPAAVSPAPERTTGETRPVSQDRPKSWIGGQLVAHPDVGKPVTVALRFIAAFLGWMFAVVAVVTPISLWGDEEFGVWWLILVVLVYCVIASSFFALYRSAKRWRSMMDVPTSPALD